MHSRLFGILAAILFVLFAVWLVSATEWVEEDVKTPARGEAVKNRFHSLQGVLRGVGVQVVRRQALDAIPGPQATLVLDSKHWNLLPERAARLRKWVEQGGHLVISGAMLQDDERLEAWIPVGTMRSRKKPSDDDTDVPSPRERKTRGNPGICMQVHEPDAVAASYPEGRSFRLCTITLIVAASSLKTSQTFSWFLEGTQGVPMARVPVGKGSVTVISPWHMLANGEILQGDNPLIAVAALQASRGGQAWFVVEESRAPLLAWLWQNAWIAVVLSLAALGAAVWRGAVRFGPLAAGGVNARRSMAEQISGTGQFLMKHSAAALWRAQVRALDDAARRHLPRYDRSKPAAAAEAIARATGLDVRALALALSPKPVPSELPRHIELLETARRRLQLSAKPTPSSKP